MFTRSAPAHALLLSVALAIWPHAGRATTLDTFEMPLDGQAFSDEFGILLNDPTLSLEAVTNAVTVLETRLRDYADLTSVVELAPELTDRLSRNATLHGLYATGLSASGDVARARQVLEDFSGQADDVWFPLARSLLARAQGDLDLAGSHVTAALQADPQNGYAFNVAGSIDAARGDWSAAVANFESAVEAAPKAATYRANLGGAYLQRGNPDMALDSVNQARDLGALTCRTARIRSIAFSQLGQAASAVSAIEECLSQDDLDAPTIQQLVSASIASGDLAKASHALARYGHLLDRPEIWRSEVALRSGNVAMLRETVLGSAIKETLLGTERLVYAAFLDGDMEAAASLIAETVRNDEVPPDLRLAAFAARASASPRAESWSLEANTPIEHLFLAMQPDTPEPPSGRERHLAMSDGAIAGFSPDGLGLDDIPAGEAAQALAIGTALLMRGAPEPAYGTLTASAARDHALPLYLAAVSARQTGRVDEARQRASAALAAAPAFRSALLERAEAALAAGDASTAIADLQQALALKPMPSVALRLGVIADAIDKPDIARDAYETLLRLAPDNFIANNQLAWFLVSRDGDTGRALDLAERANALQPGNASVLDTIGWIHFLRGEPEKALGYLRQAFEVSDGSIPVVRYHFAAAALETGDTNLTRDLLEGFSAPAPPAELAEQIERLNERLASGN